MSLTLPTAYSNASKQGNIVENWFVQLGFFNGDADGSGDGGWDAVLQSGGAANLINLLGSELVQDGDNPDHRESTWTMRDSAGNSDGWSTGAPSPYSDDETASMINTLTGNAVDAGLHYSLTFTVGVATLSLVIGGGDLTGNTADETFVAKASYAAGTHTVTFTATADRSHLWFTADTSSAGNGTIDDVILKRSGYGTAETSIIVDDGTVFQNGDFIKIEDEIIRIISISTHTLTVDRGAMGTTAVGHSNNTALYWNNFTPISLSDTTVDDVFYHGTITSVPSIRSSIDLASSTAKTGNISLSVVNFQFKGDDFSAELFLGTRKYINREVRIYSQLNGNTTLSNCLQVYSGRLIDISHDDSSVSLKLTEQRPWDFITIPQSLTNTVSVPVSYGNFTPIGYTGSNFLFPSSFAYRPVPLVPNIDILGIASSGDLDWYTTGHTASGTEAILFYYDKSGDVFIGSGGFSSNTALVKTIDSESVYYNIARGSINPRNFKLRPLIGDQISGNTIGTPANAIDDDGSDPSVTNVLEVDVNSIVNGSSDAEKIRIYQFKQTRLDGNYDTTGSADGITFDVWYDLRIDTKTDSTAVCNVILYYKFTDGSEGTGSGWISLESLVSSSGQGTITSLNRQNGVASSSSPASIDIGEGKEKHLYLKALFATDDASNSFDGRIVIKDIQINYDMENDENKPEELLYVGIDGLTESWSGASAAIQYGHEALRDLLIRYAGYTTTAPENWSALNTDRGIPAWKIRWWALEPVELKKVLEQIMYEFGFIFKFRADGTGSVIHILQTSELSAVQTFKKDDITNLKIRNTPFSELLTQMEINYEKHPAENRYLSSVTSSNSTARSNWNIQAKENIKKVNLEMNVGTPNTSGQTDGNADFYSYYDNIFGDIKKIISCEIVNPSVSYNLETGDIIQFSNTAGEMPVDPFGDNWADYYMITDLKRSPGKVGITVREVG